MDIGDARYPLLVEFMSKFLYQLAAPTFEEAILQWTAEGPNEVRKLIDEINRVLGAGHTNEELEALIHRHSDYGCESGAETLSYFRAVLTEWLVNAPRE
jgi:hypothetical protein